jgi:hypothetical protein
MADSRDPQPSDQAEQENAHAADIQRALQSPDLPQYYVNSFTVTVGTGDVLIVMKRNNQQIGMIQVSYTVAKSLGEVLSDVIAGLEKVTGHEIMTSKYIERKVQEGNRYEPTE